jgi:hypothetical protein
VSRLRWLTGLEREEDGHDGQQVCQLLRGQALRVSRMWRHDLRSGEGRVGVSIMGLQGYHYRTRVVNL